MFFGIITMVMKFIGITGGVGAGKSTVLALLKEMTNSIIVPADRLAEALLETGSPVLEQVAGLSWPKSVLRADGSMDRALVAEFIYSDESLRVAMDEIVHPAVKEAVLDMRRQAEQEGKIDYFFFEAALLIEAGYKELVDQVWYIYTDREIRRKRLKESRGYSDERIDEIMNKQLTETQFREAADVVIDNSSDEEGTRNQLKEILNEL